MSSKKRIARGRPPSPPVIQPEGGRVLLVAAALSLLVTLTFSCALRNGFVFDDEGYVLGNQHVETGLTAANLHWAFQAFHAGNWHPLTWISHQMDAQLWGLSPAGHHLTSILLHAANTVLLLVLLRRLTGWERRSLVAAALFGLHPLRVESVAWVAERKDVLSLFFFLLTCCAWRWHLARPSQRRYGLTLLLFAFALMAKSVVVTLPLLLLLLDWWPLGRWNGRHRRGWSLVGSAGLFAEKAPFLALSVAAGILAIFAQRSEGALVGLQRYPLETRFANAGVSCVSYLSKTIWPFGLSAFYPHPSGLSVGLWLGSIVSLAVLTVLALTQARRRPWLATGWLWYLIALVPVIGIVQVGAQAMADRYTYLPSIGLVVAAVWAAAETKVRGRGLGWLSGTVVAGLLSIYCSTTWIQCGYWRNDFTLFSHASALDPGNWLAHNNVGRQLLLQKRWPDAEERFRESIKHNPNYATAFYNLGVAAREQGRAVEAEASFREAVRLKPIFLQARMDLGKLLRSLGRPTEAQREFEEAIRLAPGNPDAHLDLGVALYFQGKPDLALLSFEKAYRINPDVPEVLSNIGRSLSDQGRNQEALPFLQRALEVKPGFAVAHYNLGTVFERLGRFHEAEEEYRRALALTPGFRPAQEALNGLLGRVDRSRP